MFQDYTIEEPLELRCLCIENIEAIHYFFKLIPRWPTFPQDMTDEERRLRDEHGRYFQDQFARGHILVLGPVMATGEAFGLALVS